MIHQKMIDFQDFTTQSILAVTSRRSGTVQNNDNDNDNFIKVNTKTINI